MDQPGEFGQGSAVDRWNERISTATSADAQRELLTEAARWRAQHLSDLPAVRAATLAISRLHALMGDRERAAGEARQLISLCQSAPEASAEEYEAARSVLAGLGESVPRMGNSRRGQGANPRERGRERDRVRGQRPEGARQREGEGDRRKSRASEERQPGDRTDAGDRRSSVMIEARKLASKGDWEGTIALLDGVSSAPAAVLRALATLTRAVDLGGDLRAAVEQVRADLLRSSSLSLRPADAPSASEDDEHLAEILGVPVPSKRPARIRLIEEYAEKHASDPARLDELASAALRQHVTSNGIGSPAPWLVGVTGRAFALGEAPQTRLAIGELRSASAVAVQAYDEWPFERLVRLTKRAEATGHSAGAMRRGVLARGESDDRKLWTLRISKDGVERMVAVAPHASAPYPDGKAEELAERLIGLCPRTLLLATGFGNGALRTACASKGLLVMEHDADDDAILAQLDTLGAQAEAAERGPAPPKRLAELLAPGTTVGLDELTEVIRSFRRPDRAMRVVQRLDLDDARTELVLRAVHAAAEPNKPIPEATTIAVRTAAHGPLTRALVTLPGPVADRFSGPGMGEVIDLAKTLMDASWELHRVLRGPTRRECTAHPVLETLSPSMSGLWRLLIRKGDRKGEVWFLADLPPEGRAGVPQLLLEDWQRVVVLPLDPDLLAWWRQIAPNHEALGWTGAEGGALIAAVETFVAKADPHEEDGANAP